MTEQSPDSQLPGLIDPADLADYLTDDTVIVDLSRQRNRASFPLPGSVWLDYANIVSDREPAAGLLPAIDSLTGVLGGLGITRQTPLIAYDDEGGGKAARLLWTLDHLGHDNHALLDGGLIAWVNAGLPLDSNPVARSPTEFAPQLSQSCIADAEFILDRLEDAQLQLIDARSPEEYSGQRQFAARGGHIPGAIHCDWVELMDRDHDMRLRPVEELMQRMQDKGIDLGRETVTYCQTHHRSSLVYYVLTLLGAEQVRGYPGSWSDWGNRPDTPVEAG